MHASQGVHVGVALVAPEKGEAAPHQLEEPIGFGRRVLDRPGIVHHPHDPDVARRVDGPALVVLAQFHRAFRAGVRIVDQLAGHVRPRGSEAPWLLMDLPGIKPATHNYAQNTVGISHQSSCISWYVHGGPQAATARQLLEDVVGHGLGSQDWQAERRAVAGRVLVAPFSEHAAGLLAIGVASTADRGGNLQERRR